MTLPTRIAIVGGGPGGLFLASLLKRGLPSLQVTVIERNQRTDAFGFGVVFSDATLRNINDADTVLDDLLRESGRHWDRIEVWSGEERHGFAGNGMAAVHRKELLARLQNNAEQLGAELRFGTEAPALDQLLHEVDVVVGADGTNSSVRAQLEHTGGSVGHAVDVATAKFIWFGTTRIFDGLTFVHRVSEHGNFAAHAYPISDELSTFIVETDEDTWRRAGLDDFDVDQPPGPSDTASQTYLEALFADDLAGGHLVANNSRWGNFRTRRTEQWHRDRVALLGDAVHTAHFSVGSGTKMAMEDAVVLAEQLLTVARGEQDLEPALATYEEERKASVGKIQASAGPSLSWWEHFGTYQRTLDPVTFAFHFFSRSIGVAKIAQRDPALVGEVREHWLREHGAPALADSLGLPGTTEQVGRRLRLDPQPDGGAVLVDDQGTRLTLPVVEVGTSVQAAVDALPAAGAVVVHGAPGLERALVSEHARLVADLVVVVAGDDVGDADVAETLLLSGRADAVADSSEPAR